MPQWLLELKGAKYDINVLRRFLPEHVRIEQKDEQYWMTVGATGLDGYDAARMHGSRALALCNAYAATRVDDFRLVSAGVLRGIDEGGRVTDYISIGAATMDLRAFPVTIYSADDGPPAPPPPDTAWWRLAEEDSWVSNTLECWANHERDWPFRCWDVYERIRDDLTRSSKGAHGRAIITQWMEEDPQVRFGPSVNHHRHAGKDPLPEKPMGQAEACEFVRRLLGLWLDHKLSAESDVGS